MEKAKDRENNKNRWKNSCREREGGGAKGNREEVEASHRQHIFDSFTTYFIHTEHLFWL